MNTTPSEKNTQIATAQDRNLLVEAGITENDLTDVIALAGTIDRTNPLSIAEFGREVSEHTNRYADSLLEQIRAKDMQETGALLGEVVLAAKTINLSALSEQRSRIPVIGRFIDRFKLTKEKVVQQFETTKQQVDSLIEEVGKTQHGLTERIVSLDSMFHSVKEEYRLLGLHIAAGRMYIAELKAQADTLRAKELTPGEAQDLHDIETSIANLDKRIGDLKVMQHSALQSLPMVRMIQANNQQLIEKFHTIRELTVPAWKRQFMIALSLNEQQNAVQLTEQIDAATNAFLERNADLLKQNAVATAKANQRLVIDVKTLESVQNSLISTVQEVIKIQQEGIRARHESESKLLSMRKDLENKLTRKIPAPEAA